MLPLAAIAPRSVARQSARGPDSPKGVIRTQTAPGARSGSTWSAPGQPGVSRTTSVPASNASRRGSSAPQTRPVLPTFQARKRREASASVRSPMKGPTRRSGSPPGGSTLTTSAPRSASRRPVICPGSAARSTTRTPCKSASATPPPQRPHRAAPSTIVPETPIADTPGGWRQPVSSPRERAKPEG